MSVLFKDISDDTTIEITGFSRSPSVLIELLSKNDEIDWCINLDIHTAIQVRKALSLAIGKARNSTGGSNE
tara:strand:+ start:79 stop:291 length:213 start_codon:yes stop_codon:yes gene_type:complete